MNRLYRLLIFCLMFLSTWIWSATDAEQTLNVQLTITPQNKITVKQSFTLRLDIMTEGWFSEEPKVSIPQMTGLVLVPDPIAKGPISKTDKGKSYSGVFMEFAAFATQAGKLSLGEIVISARIAQPPNGSVDAVYSTQQVPLEVHALKSDVNLDKLLVAEDLVVKQVWEPDLNEATVGDSIARTITFEAKGTISMLIPPMENPSASGTSQYSEKVRLSDSSSRGTMTAKRQETIHYQMESKGSLALPSITFSWYDATSEQIKTFTLDKKTVKVKANPNYRSTSNISPSSSRIGITSLIVIILFMPIAFGIYWVFGEAIIRRVNVRYQRFQARPSQQFKHLCQSLPKQTPIGAYHAIHRWLKNLPKGAVLRYTKCDSWQALQSAITNNTPFQTEKLIPDLQACRKDCQREQVSNGDTLRPLYPQ